MSTPRTPDTPETPDTPDGRISGHLRQAAGAPAAYTGEVADAVERRAAAVAVAAAARRRRQWLAGAAAALVVVGGAAAVLALRDDDGGRRLEMADPPPTTQTTLPPTTDTTGRTSTTPTVPTSSTSALPPGALDWTGERWDFGEITALRRERGAWRLDFDRKQLEQDGRFRSGKELVREPVLAGYITDDPTANEGAAIRSYRVAPRAEVLVWANRDEVCAWDGQGEMPEVRWRQSTVSALAESREYRDHPWTALTFDGAGTVTRIRLSTGC